MNCGGKSDHFFRFRRLFSPGDLRAEIRLPPGSPAPPSPDIPRCVSNLCDSAYPLPQHLIMTGLSRAGSFELPYHRDDRHEPTVTGPLPPPTSSTTTTMAHSVRYIPTQMDTMASLSTQATRQSPIRLMLQDTGVLIANLRYLPDIVLPFKGKNSSDEFYLDCSGYKDIIVQSLLLIIEALSLIVAIPAFLILPGLAWMTVCAACSVLVYGLSKLIEGPTVVYSNMSKETVVMANQHRSERWLFINGCIVG